MHEMPLLHGPIYYDIPYNTVAECKPEFKLSKDTPYLALMGELWDVYYEDFRENLSCNSTALYIDWSDIWYFR